MRYRCSLYASIEASADLYDHLFTCSLSLSLSTDCSDEVGSFLKFPKSLSALYSDSKILSFLSSLIAPSDRLAPSSNG